MKAGIESVYHYTWFFFFPSFFIFLCLFFIFIYLSVLPACVYVYHMYAWFGQRALDLLELELQVVPSHLMRLLGTELRFSERASNAFNHLAISLVQSIFIFNCVYVSVSACGVQKKVPNSLELELQAVVSHLAWVLETKLRCPSRVVHKLNLGAISAAPDSHAYSPKLWLPSPALFKQTVTKCKFLIMKLLNL